MVTITVELTYFSYICLHTIDFALIVVHSHSDAIHFLNHWHKHSTKLNHPLNDQKHGHLYSEQEFGLQP